MGNVTRKEGFLVIEDQCVFKSILQGLNSYVAQSMSLVQVPWKKCLSCVLSLS